VSFDEPTITSRRSQENDRILALFAKHYNPKNNPTQPLAEKEQ
jgi:hypothetical protein